MCTVHRTFVQLTLAAGVPVLFWGLERDEAVTSLLSVNTVYSVQYTVFTVQYIVYGVQCTVYKVQFTVYSVQCTVYSVQCTVYSVEQ